MGGSDVAVAAAWAADVIKRRDAGERDRAADRASSAARALAAVAHDAARQHVQRDAVAPHSYGTHPLVMACDPPVVAAFYAEHDLIGLDVAERERILRLRRWHEPPHPNRKDG